MSKKTLGLLVFAFFVFVVSGTAKAVTFSFDSLSPGATIADIESYMEGLYGSDITVVNASVGNSGTLGPDSYIDASGDLAQKLQGLSFSFNAVPITSVSFDWARLWGAWYNYDNFFAYRDGVLFFARSGGEPSSGNSGTFDFTSTPVTTLRFTGSWYGSNSVDNLIVTPIPEPTSLLLLGSGLLGLAAFGRAKRKKSLKI